MSTKMKHFSKKAALICLTPLLCNTIQAQEENNPQTELAPEQTKFNAANSAILDTVSNIVKQQVNLGTFIITGGNPDNNLTSIQEGIDQIIADLEGGGGPSGFSTSEQVDNLGTSSDTSDIYSDFVHLGATSGDVSNLNTRLTTIDTNLATKATSTQVTTAQTNIQGTAGTDGLTIGAIEGSGFASSANSLVALTSAVTTLGTSALATNQQAVDIQGSGFFSPTNSLYSICGVGYDPATYSLVKIGGAGFSSTTDSLKVISDVLDTKASQDSLNTMAASTTLAAVQSAIQGTAGTNGLTLGAIEGSGFASSTNSLVALTSAVTTLGTSALATSAQVNNLGTVSDTSGIRSDFVSLGSGEGDVSSLSTALALLATITQVNNLGTINDTSNVVVTNIEQGIVTPFIVNPTSNSTATDNKVNSQGAIIKIASSNAALTTPVAMTSASGDQITDIATYNDDLTTALADVNTVISNIQTNEPTSTINANTAMALNDLIIAINSFSPMVFDDVVPTSGYSLASINAALNELYLTLTYVFALTTPTP